MKKVLCVVAALFLLTACSGETSEAPTAEGETTGSGTRTERFEEPVLADKFEIRTAEEDGRESLSRAVRLRDLEFREKQGIGIRYDRRVDRADVCEATLADYASGTGPELVEGGFAETLAPLFAAGAIAPFPESCARFSESSLKSGDNAYFLTTPLVPEAYGDVSCILMNGEVADRFHVTGPAEAVRSGTWTWDRLAASAAVVPPGSELFRYAAADESVGCSAILAAGDSVSEPTPSGVTVKATIRSGADAALEAVKAILSDGATAFLGEETAPRTAAADAAFNLFSGSEALFLFCKTRDIPRLRQSGTDFRIFPYPGSAGRSGADSVKGAAAATVRGADGRLVFAVMPELLRLSEKYVLPEVTDAYLSGPSSYDAESGAILAGILSGAEYEPGLAFAGEDGAELEEMLTRAATGRGTLGGWELKAALVRAGAG